MNKEIRFGVWEASALVINSMIVQVFVSYPRSMINVSGTAAWITAIYVAMLAYLGFLIIQGLYKNFEGKDILEVSEIAGGKILKVVVGFLIILQFLSVISITIREFGEDLKVVTFPVSPISYIIIFFLIGMVIAALLGIESIVRLNVLAIPVVIAGSLIIVAGIMSNVHLYNITPIWGTGFKDIFLTGSFKISSYSAITILFLIVPFIKTHRNLKRAGTSIILISSMFFIFSTLLFLLVVPYNVAVETFLPMFELARLIDYGRFFQRVESVFLFVWIISALSYFSAGLFFASYVFQKTFNLKYYKPVVFSFAILIFTLSLLPPDLMTVIKLDSDVFRKYSGIFTFLVPIIVLSIANITRRRSE